VRLLVGLILLPAEAYASRLGVSCDNIDVFVQFLNPTKERSPIETSKICTRFKVSINLDDILLLPIIANTGILFGDGR